MENLNEKYIAQGALTNSKRKESFIEGVYPVLVDKAYESIIESNGVKYIDFICGLGTNLIGYANPKVIDAVTHALQRGNLPSLPTEDEGYLIELLHMKMPFIKKAKILKTGSEACSAAVRIARAFTMVKNPDKNLILSEGYHGWHDHFCSLTPPACGIIRNNNDDTENIHGIIKMTCSDILNPCTWPWFKDKVSCIIVEPIITDISEERIQYLRDLRKFCTENDIILIFDEVITGMRFPKFSVSSYYEIFPDLICLGKALGNGMPISIVGGRKDLMDNPDYFVSSSFAGDRASISAAITTLHLLKENANYRLANLWQEGESFIKKFNEIMIGIVHIDGYPTRGIISDDCQYSMDGIVRAKFFQEACKAKMIFGASFFFNFDHIKHKESVLSALSDIAKKINSNQVKLEGKMPVSPFAQKVRES